MGSITKVESATGTHYRARWRKPDHTQGSKRFPTKKEAVEHLANVEVSKSRGDYIDPNKGKILLSVWLEQWLAGRTDLQPTSRERVRGIIVKHINPTLGKYPLSALDHETIQGWASRLSTEGEQGSWSTRKIVNVLSGALQKAVKSGRLRDNHAHGLDLPKISKTQKRYLTHAQVLALAAAVDAIGRGIYSGAALGYGLLIKVMAYCGPRWGEVSGFRVKDVDFVKRRINVVHTIVEVNGHQLDSVPKDYEARAIPVPASLLTELAVWVKGRNGNDPLFPGARGGWLRGRVFRRGWLNAAAASIGEDGLTPHELRHTAASLAVSSGANVKGVQKMLGHASAAVTLDIYADLFDSDLDTVSVRMDAAIAEAIVSQVRLSASLEGVPQQSP